MPTIISTSCVRISELKMLVIPGIKNRHFRDQTCGNHNSQVMGPALHARWQRHTTTHAKHVLPGVSFPDDSAGLPVSHKQDDHTRGDTGHTKEDTAKHDTYMLHPTQKKRSNEIDSIRRRRLPADAASDSPLFHSHRLTFLSFATTASELSISISPSRGKLPCRGGGDAMDAS